MLAHRLRALRVFRSDTRPVPFALLQVRERHLRGVTGHGLRLATQGHVNRADRRVCAHGIPLHRQARRIDVRDSHAHLRGHTRRRTRRRNDGRDSQGVIQTDARLAEVVRRWRPPVGGHDRAITNRLAAAAPVLAGRVAQRQVGGIEASARRNREPTHPQLTRRVRSRQGRGRNRRGRRRNRNLRVTGAGLVAVRVRQHDRHRYPATGLHARQRHRRLAWPSRFGHATSRDRGGTPASTIGIAQRPRDLNRRAVRVRTRSHRHCRHVTRRIGGAVRVARRR